MRSERVEDLADPLGDESQRRDSLPAVLAGDLNCTPESDEYRWASYYFAVVAEAKM